MKYETVKEYLDSEESDKDFDILVRGINHLDKWRDNIEKKTGVKYSVQILPSRRVKDIEKLFDENPYPLPKANPTHLVRCAGNNTKGCKACDERK